MFEKLSNMRWASESTRGLRGANTTTWTSSDPSPLLKLLCLSLFWSIIAQVKAHRNQSYLAAELTYSYPDIDTGELVHGVSMGRYGIGSLVLNSSGYMVHVRVEDGKNHGCWEYVNSPNAPSGATPWIALVQRGECKFQKKVDMAIEHNASAIIIYNNRNHVIKDGGYIDIMDHDPVFMTTVFISYTDGQRLVQLVDDNVSVFMNIALGDTSVLAATNQTHGATPNKHTTKVLLVFVGFLILGLIVVVGYAVRHAKYVHSRNQANLTSSSQEAQQAQQETLMSNGTGPEQQIQHELLQRNHFPPSQTQQRYHPPIQEDSVGEQQSEESQQQQQHQEQQKPLFSV